MNTLELLCSVIFHWFAVFAVFAQVRLHGEESRHQGNSEADMSFGQN
jgi:hypothetical protein